MMSCCSSPCYERCRVTGNVPARCNANGVLGGFDPSSSLPSWGATAMRPGYIRECLSINQSLTRLRQIGLNWRRCTIKNSLRGGDSTTLQCERQHILVQSFHAAVPKLYSASPVKLIASIQCGQQVLHAASLQLRTL